MSLTGSGPDDPQRVGVPIADLLAGMYGAYGVVAALNERHRTGVGTVVRTSLLAAVVGVHAFQGTRWTVAGEVGRAQGNHHPSITPVRPVPLPRRLGADRGRQRGPVAPALRRASASTRPPPGWPRTPSGSPTASGSSRSSRRPSPTGTPSRCSPGSPRSACPPARCARSTRSMRGTRPRARACSSTSSTRRSGRLTLPGPPLRFFDGDGTEVTRRAHGAPDCSTSTAPPSAPGSTSERATR